ncbi:hypothetical protein CXB51_030213 [Gossypium anomalum]|uniref:Uncharacterized protein n=1 Tax=Gossypium anomalum TaxID=47600 RepID=A0A8J6CNB3_9ROSI|nr:hypothetical protein CXB51_030213 [Gossypium anomalum]
MEEYSKGNLEVEDSQNVQVREEENKEEFGVVNGGEDDSSSSSSRSDKEDNSEEKLVSESVEEKVVSESVGVSLTEDTEPSVEKLGDSDVAELDDKETEEKVSPSLESDHTNAKETEELSAAETTVVSELSTDVESKETGQDETNDSTVGGAVVVADQGITDDNGGNPSGSPGLSSNQNVEDSLEAANVPPIETRDAGEVEDKPVMHETIENQVNSLTLASIRKNYVYISSPEFVLAESCFHFGQTILSVGNRSVQPTSWKSCCGLFEVLRRSDR